MKERSYSPINLLKLFVFLKIKCSTGHRVLILIKIVSWIIKLIAQEAILGYLNTQSQEKLFENCEESEWQCSQSLNCTAVEFLDLWC